ncbi:MAG: T9SS type A sorting domain-containing protein [Saprospiraceae bacterium]|nr:T9SS type A sorting domain-containing protein [Saprospiraceae bacterium]
MKLLSLFFLAFLLSMTTFAQYEGFENWSTDTILSLNDYNTAVSENPSSGVGATSRSTDAYLGTYSIRLEPVVETSGDTTFGFFLSGDPDNFKPGQPVTLSPNGSTDSIIGYYKYDILPNDTAVLLAQTFLMGAPTGGGAFFITGSQPNWTRFAYHIGAAIADSLLIAAANGNPLNNFNGLPGSWIQFDNIQLKNTSGTQDIINHSFENWSSFTWDTPDGWNTSNDFAIGQPILPCQKTTDSYSGSYGLKLTTIGNNLGNVLGGYATNGTMGQNGMQGGAPFFNSPVGIEFYYKYTPSGVDTGFSSFQFSQNGIPVYQLGNSFIDTTSSYTLWSDTILSVIYPDSLLITLWSGSTPGSELIIDNIDFAFAIIGGFENKVSVEQLVAYPVPATDKIKLRFSTSEGNNVIIKFIDIQGKELLSRSMGYLPPGTYRESFNTSDFASGVYFIEFTLGSEKFIERFNIK